MSPAGAENSMTDSRPPTRSPARWMRARSLINQSSAQVARVDHGWPAVATLPASLDEDLLRLADQPKDDVEAGAGVVDRLHAALRRWQRQEREDLAQVLFELLAEICGRPIDVPSD